MKKLLASAVALSLPLAGCTITPPSISRVQSSPDVVMTTGTKALIEAEFAYNTVGTMALEGLRSGLITGQRATRVRQINKSVTKLFVDGYNAKNDVQKKNIAELIAIATSQLSQLLGR